MKANIEEYTVEHISTDKAPAAIGPYSQAVAVDNLVYTSGQIPLDATTGEVIEGDISAQTVCVCENLARVLEAADSGLDSVVKTTCFLTDMNDFAVFNEIYARYFTTKPARSCIAVSALPKGVHVEIEAVALRN